jgi:hypothetical protein
MAETLDEAKWWQGKQYRRMLNPGLSLELVDRAMERAFGVFTSGWYAENAKHPACFCFSTRGSGPFTFLFELGIDLLLVSECLRLPSVVNDLRRASAFSSTRTELSLAAALTRYGHQVEFRPPLPHGKCADLAVRDHDETVFIEIKLLSQSEAQVSFQRLCVALVLALSDLQRRAPWSGCAGLGYEIDITSKTLGRLGAGAEADEATIAAVVDKVGIDLTSQFANGEPPFDFYAASYARVRIARDAKCTLTGPPFAPELELKRILQKHFRNPTDQLPPLQAGILVIRTGSVLDATLTRNTVEQLLARQGVEAGQISAVVFLPVYSSFPVRRSMFRAFAVLNPSAQFPAKHLGVYKSLCNIYDIAE